MSKFIVTQDDFPCGMYNGLLTSYNVAFAFDTRRDAETAIRDTNRHFSERGASVPSPDEPDVNGVTPREVGYTHGGFRIIEVDV